MKTYTADVTIRFTNVGIEAENKTEAMKIVKEIYKDQYDIDLIDREIELIEQKKGH
jgi:hypothetical protein